MVKISGLDITLGLGYRAWLPQGYSSVQISMANYLTWRISAQARLFDFLNIHKGYYESNGLSGPRTGAAPSIAQVGSYIPQAAWLLGMIGFPIFKH
ncbi:MAG: hypothetical protein IPJ88_02155 [Myxococcales bacterium]|nr:MAG: hypothetical protein IPJ88_02155 [Myxococcales bacterium]